MWQDANTCTLQSLSGLPSRILFASPQLLTKVKGVDSLQDQGNSIRPGQCLNSDSNCNGAGKSLKENIAHFITEPLGLKSTVEGGDVPFNKSAIAPNLTDAFLRNSNDVSGLIPFYDPSLVCCCPCLHMPWLPMGANIDRAACIALGHKISGNQLTRNSDKIPKPYLAYLDGCYRHLRLWGCINDLFNPGHWPFSAGAV